MKTPLPHRRSLLRALVLVARHHEPIRELAASGSVEELLSREDISIVINLTIPAAHAEVDQQIIDAGKHVWSEKPIATDHESAEIGRAHV